MKDNPLSDLSFVMQYSCTNLGYELKWDSAEKRDVQQLKNKKLNRPSIVKNTLMLFSVFTSYYQQQSQLLYIQYLQNKQKS